MKSLWPKLSRAFFNNPLALMGRRRERIGRRPTVQVRACCHVCNHYEPPKNTMLTVDGDPGAYCKHPTLSKGNYLNDELIDQLNLRRAPLDWCERFSLRKELGQEILERGAASGVLNDK